MKNKKADQLGMNPSTAAGREEYIRRRDRLAQLKVKR